MKDALQLHQLFVHSPHVFLYTVGLGEILQYLFCANWIWKHYASLPPICPTFHGDLLIHMDGGYNVG